MILSGASLRNSFVKELIIAAEKEPTIYLLCADLGYGVLEPFIKRFPSRFINVGIAEQNMIGIAAGLALSGKKVFTYSIVNFAITRCLEQIRNDVCYHNLDVTMVAVGGGVPYGVQGYTHQGVEDIAFTRLLPNINVFGPADEFELRYCMSKILSKKGPTYLRLARGGEPKIHKKEIESNSLLIEVLPKKKVNFIVNGTPLKGVLDASIELDRKNVSVGLFSMPHLTLNTKNEILEIAKESSYLITVEEHLTEGGLGSLVAEIISGLSQHAQLIRKGITHSKLDKVGGQAFLRKENKIDKDSLVSFVLEFCNGQEKSAF